MSCEHVTYLVVGILYVGGLVKKKKNVSSKSVEFVLTLFAFNFNITIN